MGTGRERGVGGAKKNIKGREHCACSPERPDIGTIGEKKSQGGSKVRVVTRCSLGIDFSVVCRRFASFKLSLRGGGGARSTSGGSVCLFSPPDCTSPSPPSSATS